MNFKQPFYTLRLNTQHCGYRLAVNGCLIDEDRVGQMNSMEYPINQWLKNGENTIDIHHLNNQPRIISYLMFYSYVHLQFL